MKHDSNPVRRIFNRNTLLTGHKRDRSTFHSSNSCQGQHQTQQSLTAIPQYLPEGLTETAEIFSYGYSLHDRDSKPAQQKINPQFNEDLFAILILNTNLFVTVVLRYLRLPQQP